MASRFKASKYKHTVGSISKKELWYPDLKPASCGESTGICASGKWIAVQWSSAGAVALLDLSQFGKRKATELPTIFGHSAAIADMSFNPFSDSLLATSSDDSLVKVWKIPDSLTENISNASYSLTGHKKRVDTLAWNPTCAYVLATGSSDKSVRIWDVEAGKDQLQLEGTHGDTVHSISWNGDGSLLATISKDKKIRVIDPRANSVVQQGEAHQGIKSSRVIWLSGLNKIVSTGFSKTRDRQVGVWDSTNLSAPLQMSTIDASTGIVEPFYDPDTNMLFFCGKGDSAIRVVEVQTDAAKAPFYTDLTTVASDTPQQSSALIPKRACDLMGAEVNRVLKLTNNAVVPITFVVPRKTKSEFQEDLYPPTASTEPAIKATSEWFSGTTKSPLLIQLKATNPNKFWVDDKDMAGANAPPSSSSSSSSVPSSSSSSPSSERPTSSPATDERAGAAANSASRGPGMFAKEPAPKVEKLVTEIKKVNVVRSSKYRHIACKGTKKEECYTNLRILASSATSNFIKANPHFFIVPWQGSGGLAAVVSINGRGGRQSDKLPYLECGSDVLDFDFNPFDDHVVATVTEMAHLQIWKLPQGGLKTSLRQPDVVLKGHSRRVTTVDFHPTASNVVLTSAGDSTLRLWDIENQKEALKLEGPSDMVLNVGWNITGSYLAVSSKDREMRLYDPRQSGLAGKILAHEGAKGFKLAWLGREERIATVGSSKGSERQISVWDVRTLGSPSSLSTVSIDSGSGFITPYYDMDTSVLFLAGKGDGNIKMYEIDNEAPYAHYLTDYTSNDPALGVALLPKTACDVKICEIARFYKLSGDFVEPLSFRVPRTKTEFFQDDIYPPTRVVAPTTSASEWFSGVTKEPQFISLQPSGMKPLSEAPQEKKVMKYVFDPNQEEELTREKMLDKYYQQMGSRKEEDNQVLKQDQMEGCAAEEWD